MKAALVSMMLLVPVAQADVISTCTKASEIGEKITTIRQSGVSLQEVSAALMETGDTPETRNVIRLARVVYDLPIGKTQAEKNTYITGVKDAFFQLCLKNEGM